MWRLSQPLISTFRAIVELIKPRGHIALIDAPQSLKINSIKPKALSFGWEFMFARSIFQTHDVDKAACAAQSSICAAGRWHAGVDSDQEPRAVSAETLIAAHREQENGRVIGKNVLASF